MGKSKGKKAYTYQQFLGHFLPNRQATCDHCFCRVLKMKYCVAEDWKCCKCELVWSERWKIKVAKDETPQWGINSSTDPKR